MMLYLALMISNQLLAQKDSSAEHVLDEIIVTANKQEQKQSTTGKVITIIDKNQLAKSGGKNLPQVLNEIVGVTINGANNNIGTNQTVYMRGAASGRTLILLDGIAVNDPSTINSEFDLNFISLSDVERIEVCKGAQSTIYGSDAIGGVINIITLQKDVHKTFNVKAGITAGSFNTYKNNVQIFGKVKRLNYSIRNSYIRSSGFSTAFDSSFSNTFDKDGYKGNSTRANAMFAVNNKLTVKVFGMQTKYTSSIDDGMFKDDKQQFIKNRILQLGGGFQYKHHKITITGNYQFAETKRNYKRDSTDQLVFNYFLRNKYFAQTQFFELYANIYITPTVSLLQGIEYRQINMRNNYLSVSEYGPYTNQFNDTTTFHTSIYSSLLLNSKKRFATDLGVRYNYQGKLGKYFTFSINPSYKINEQTRVFASVASGFKAPSLYQLFDGYSGNSNLQPEKSTTAELGASNKTTKVSNRLVVFYRSLKDGIDYDYVNSKYFNFFQQKVLGMEIENSVKINDRFELNTNLCLLSIKDSTQSRVSFIDTTFNYGLKRPNLTANASVNYRQNKFFSSISFKYAGSRFDVGGYGIADIKLPGYLLVNAYAEYMFNIKTKLFVDVQNLTNQRFFDLRGFNSLPLAANAGINISL